MGDGIAMTDTQSLFKLRHLAHDDAQQALPEVAKQFEGVFMQAMLKSMHKSAQFMDESNPFYAKHTEDFKEMLDAQYVHEMGKNQGLGLANILEQQLGKKHTGDADNTLKPFQGNNPYLHASIPTAQASKAPAAACYQTHSSPLRASESVSADHPVHDFVKALLPYAKKAASALGLDPKILLAQAALETGWGRSIISNEDGQSSHNLFNIKASAKAEQRSVTATTTEYFAHTPVKTTAAFKSYSDVGESFADYVRLLQDNERYGDALNQVASPESFVHALHRAGYATDPSYADKILSIYHSDAMQSISLDDEQHALAGSQE